MPDTRDSPKPRDWYDRATLAFQIAVAVIGGGFTLIQWYYADLAKETASREQKIESDAAKRAVIIKYLYDAVSSTASADPSEQNKGYRLLRFVNNDSFFADIGLDRAKEKDLADLLYQAQKANTDVLAKVDPRQAQRDAAIGKGSCVSDLRHAHAAVNNGVSEQDCWIYLGWYKGGVDADGRCKEAGGWQTRYLDFKASACPISLLGPALTVSEKTGALYVRSAPGTSSGVAPTVGGLYPSQRVIIDQIQSSADDHGLQQGPQSEPGRGQLWGHIKNVLS